MSKQSTAVAAQKKNLPVAVDYGSVAGVGLENATRDDFAIPFLQIIQKMSPHLTKSDPGFIKGAQAGMLLNTATNEVFDGEEGVTAIPCYYKRSFVAWVIREKGGGYRGEYAPLDPIVGTTQRDDKGREMLPDGMTQLVDTRLFGVLLIGPGGVTQPAIITMSSTQIKKAKRWCTQMDQLQAAEESESGKRYPIFAHAYQLRTISEANDKGSWDGWVIEHAGLLHEVLPGPASGNAFNAAKAFYHSLESGTAKLRPAAPEETDDDGSF